MNCFCSYVISFSAFTGAAKEWSLGKKSCDLKVKFNGDMLGMFISISSGTSSPVSSKAGVITLNMMSWEGYCVNIITSSCWLCFGLNLLSHET